MGIATGLPPIRPRAGFLHEHDSPPQREEGQGWWVVSSTTATTPNPSLPRRGIIFMTGGEPKDHEVSARNDKRLSGTLWRVT
jgi:hypothetical protein